MEIAENTTLAIAIVWVLWQILSLRDAAVNGKGIFPAIIPSSILFGVSIALVLFFHLSPFHLLWLSIACFVFGFLAIILPPVQSLSMSLLAFLAMTSTSETDRDDEIVSELPIFSEKSKPKKSQGDKRGFG